jgi:hypothetical protein
MSDGCDYDDPVIEAAWCHARRKEVIDYLQQQNVIHGQVGEWPAWHVAPYVSIWAVESHATPGKLGWWVICGDLPTDSLSAASVKHPREAMRAFGQLWQEYASYMTRGEPHPTTCIGSAAEWPALGPLLNTRGQMLLQWANDETIWEDQNGRLAD